MLSIAFGTGANVAIFSTADALLLRPVPVRETTSLITVGSIHEAQQHGSDPALTPPPGL